MNDLNGNRFFLLWDLYRVFDDDKALYKQGFVSELAVCKVLDKSDNPSSTSRFFVHELVNDNVLKFNSDGNLVLDNDKFMELFSDNKYFKEIKNAITSRAILFID